MPISMKDKTLSESNQGIDEWGSRSVLAHRLGYLVSKLKCYRVMVWVWVLCSELVYQYQLLCMRCSYQHTVREGDAGSNFAWSSPRGDTDQHTTCNCRPKFGAPSCKSFSIDAWLLQPITWLSSVLHRPVSRILMYQSGGLVCKWTCNMPRKLKKANVLCHAVYKLQFPGHCCITLWEL